MRSPSAGFVPKRAAASSSRSTGSPWSADPNAATGAIGRRRDAAAARGALRERLDGGLLAPPDCRADGPRPLAVRAARRRDPRRLLRAGRRRRVRRSTGRSFGGGAGSTARIALGVARRPARRHPRRAPRHGLGERRRHGPGDRRRHAAVVRADARQQERRRRADRRLPRRRADEAQPRLHALDGRRLRPRPADRDGDRPGRLLPDRAAARHRRRRCRGA